MHNKGPISNEIQNLLEQIAEIAACKAVQKKQNSQEGTNYYRLTEKILYQYKDLKLYIEDEESYIEQYIDSAEGKGARKSKDIVMMSSGKSQSSVESEELIREKARENLSFTKQFLFRIDMALARLNEEQMELIKLMFFAKQINIDELTIKFNMSQPTLYRKRNRAVDKVGVFLFGAVIIK